MKILSLIFTTLFLATASGQNPSSYGVDSAKVPSGLRVGAVAPDFELLTPSGKTLSLRKQLAKGPVIIMFYRGAWCPVCNRHLAQVVDSVDLIASKGATILAITPNKMEEVAKTDSLLQNGLALLADDRGEVMDKYRVSFGVTEAYQEKIRTKLKSNIAKDNNQREARLPVPATFIINPKGEITWRHFDLDYHNRAGVKQMLQNLP